MKVLIIEDEGVAARRIAKLATNIGLTVIGTCKSIKAIDKYLNQHDEPDFYLSDIHLSDGLIFDLLERRPLSSPIIFTTAYDQYAIKAFKANSIDYLLKPIDPDELSQAVEKLKKSQVASTKLDIMQLKALINTQSTPTIKYKTRISVRIGEKIRSLNIEDIGIIYSENKANYILSREGRKYIIEESLDGILMFLDPDSFFKINRACIVHIDYINEVQIYSNSRLKIFLTIKSDQDLIVARDRVKEFKNWF